VVWSTPESSSDTASQPTTEPKVVLGIDPGNSTGFAVTTWFDNEPVPYAQRLSFWQRTKARLEERARERREQAERESMDIAKWLAEKAPTRGEQMAQDVVDFVVRGTGRYGYLITDGETIFEGEMDLMRSLHPAPISSARRTPTREMVEAKIINNTIDVDEVFWDLVSAIDAHRNGATALDRPWRPVEESTPVWDELVERMWDPTHERGPRERDWVRQQHKRQQPTNQSRAKRRGKR